MTMPVSYPATHADGRRWVYDGVRGYAVLLAPGVTTYTSPTSSGNGGGSAPGLVVAGVETTDYDRQGRVVSSVSFAGDLTTYTYQWNAAATTAGLGVTGGWTRVVSTPADRFGVDGAVAASDTTDGFGHVQRRTDQGGYVTQVGYDLAGRAVSEHETGAGVDRMVWLGYHNTGQLASVTEATQAAIYGYDAAGNRVYERLVSGSVVKQDGRAAYDLLGRMLSWTELAPDGAAALASLAWSYDAAGNIRSRTQSWRPMETPGLSAAATAPETLWFLYDSMNRVVLGQGEKAGGAVVRGKGVSLQYDAAGQRVSATTAANVATAGYAPGVTPTGEHRERYAYSDDGQLTQVYQADAASPGAFGAETLLASYTRDALGRVVSEQQYDPDGVTVVRSRYGIGYDNRNRVLAESATQRRGSESYTSYSTSWYNPDGTLASSAVQSWKDGGAETTNATTTYKYIWRDGPLTSAVTLSNKDGATQSLYAYDEAGRLTGVTLTGGLRPRTVAFTTDLGGQVLTRDEVPHYANAPAANPHSRRYYFEGVEMGQVGNDGTDDTTMADAVARGRAAEPPAGTTANPPGPFRGGAAAGSAYARFDRQYDAVNFSTVETAPQSYTVRGGDTLASVAQAVWGDANLWYLLAAANGLTGSEPLAAGQLLTIPSTVTNRGNTTDSYRPYDPAEALGDVQPNTPVPQPRAAPAARRKNKCGIFGAILLAVVAVAVTVVTAGATAGLGPVLSGVISGAAGSVASQAVGVVTGIQDKFSFKGVALAAISGGAAGGLASAIPGPVAGSSFLGNAVRGAAGSAITQGVAVATGLQKQFSWAGVAAAGLGAGVSAAVGGALKVDPLSLSASNIGRTLVAGAAGGIANAATRSIVEGSSFGDNLLAALPDVIASTVGSVVSASITRAKQERQRRAEEASRDTIIDPQTGKRIAIDDAGRERLRLARLGAEFDERFRASGELLTDAELERRARAAGLITNEPSQPPKPGEPDKPAGNQSEGVALNPERRQTYSRLVNNRWRRGFEVLNDVQVARTDKQFTDAAELRYAYANRDAELARNTALADANVNQLLFAGLGAPLAIGGGLASGGLLLAGGAGFFGSATAAVSIDVAQANARGYLNGSFTQQSTLGGGLISSATGERYGEGGYALATAGFAASGLGRVDKG